MRFDKKFWELSAIDQGLVVDAEIRQLEEVVGRGVTAKDRQNAFRKLNLFLNRATSNGMRIQVGKAYLRLKYA